MSEKRRVTVRPMSEDDVDAWVLMRCALWPEGSADEHREEIDALFAGDAPGEVQSAFLAEDEAQRAIGFVELSLRPFAEGCTTRPVAYVEGWFVDAAHRRRGVGRALIEAAEGWARAQRCIELASDTSPHNAVSAAAHAAVGFSDAGTVLCFRKLLPPRGWRGGGRRQRVYTEAYASVRLWGETLDPLDVTRALRLPADRTHRLGEPRLRRWRSGRVKEYAPFAHGMWLMSSRRQVFSPRLATHVAWLLDELEPRAEAVRAVQGPGVKADIFGYSRGASERAPALPRALRDRAAALGLQIVVDHWPDVPDDWGDDGDDGDRT